MNLIYIPIIMVTVPITAVLITYNIIWYFWLHPRPVSTNQDSPQSTPSSLPDYPLEGIELSTRTSMSMQTSTQVNSPTQTS